MKAMVCLWVMGGVVCSLQAGALQQKNYRVDTVTRVVSPLQFECRLKDFPYAKSARFKVTIQGIHLIQDNAAGEKARVLLQNTLDNARIVQLRNVKVRNYFRLSADVFIDNKNLVQTYVQANLATPVSSPEKVEKLTKQKNAPSDSQPSAAKRIPAYWFSKPSAAPGSTRSIAPVNPRLATLDQMLNTEVDLSMINADTPLEEALEILSHSVRPNLPLLVLWNDLENNAMIEKDEPIGVSGFGRMKLALGLKIVLHSISSSSSDLVLVPEGKVLTLGTRSGLQYKPTTRVYSVADLALPPSFVNQFNRGASSSGNSRSGRSGYNNSNRSSNNSGGGSYSTRR